MKILKCSLLLLLTVQVITFAQTNTFIGLEASANQDKLIFFDQPEILRNSRYLSGNFGFTISEGINEMIWIETGVLFKKYTAHFSFEIEDYYRKRYNSLNDAFFAFQIPLRMQVRFPLVSDQLIGFTRTGVHYTFSDYPNQRSGGSGSMTPIGSEYGFMVEYTSHEALQERFLLVEAGLGLAYIFRNDAEIYLNFSHYSGFKELIHLEIEYTNFAEPEAFAEASSNGTYLALGIGLKYPFRIGGPGKVE